ncbi:hypothetical protein LINPERPRIM_LOCUS426 [Linum perenne]
MFAATTPTANTSLYHAAVSVELPAFCNCNHKFSVLSTKTPISCNSLALSRWKCRSSLITSSDSFEVGALIGSYGFMNVTSYSGGGNLSYSSIDLEQMKAQDVGEGNVKIKLYEGRVAQGQLRGTPILFKVYPGKRAGGIEADMMAANELNAHTSLQSSPEGICRNLVVLLGGFETKTGEQWLAFRNDGKYSAADYATIVSKKISESSSLQEKSWNKFQKVKEMEYRRYYVIRIFQSVLRGLAFMHDHDRLHQSLGPSSVLLNTIAEKDAAYLIPRLRDLSFSVDISFDSISYGEGVGTLSEGLWRRATAAGAYSTLEKRAFGIADDIYAAGLLLAYLAFAPFSEAGIVDSLSLQRLIENTFQLDLEATREYCLADDRLEEAVKFLDIGDGSGWKLLEAMLNPDFRQRPTAEAVLNHSFLNASLL